MATKPTTLRSANEPDGADLAAQVSELRADMERLTTMLGDMAQGKAEGLLHRVQQSAADLTSDAQAKLQDGKASVEAKVNELSDYTRNKPLQALAWAAGAGMVFGLIFGRR